MSLFNRICRALTPKTTVIEIPRRPDPVTQPPRTLEELETWARDVPLTHLRRSAAMAIDEVAFFAGQLRCEETFRMEDVLELDLLNRDRRQLHAVSGGWTGDHAMELMLRMNASRFAAGGSPPKEAYKSWGREEPLTSASWGFVRMPEPWAPDAHTDAGLYSVGLLDLMDMLQRFDTLEAPAAVVVRLILTLGAAFSIWIEPLTHPPHELPVVSASLVTAFVRRWWSRVERIPQEL